MVIIVAIEERHELTADYGVHHLIYARQAEGSLGQYLLRSVKSMYILHSLFLFLTKLN